MAAMVVLYDGARYVHARWPGDGDGAQDERDAFYEANRLNCESTWLQSTVHPGHRSGPRRLWFDTANIDLYTTFIGRREACLMTPFVPVDEDGGTGGYTTPSLDQLSASAARVNEYLACTTDDARRVDAEIVLEFLREAISMDQPWIVWA